MHGHSFASRLSLDAISLLTLLKEAVRKISHDIMQRTQDILSILDLQHYQRLTLVALMHGTFILFRYVTLAVISNMCEQDPFGVPWAPAATALLVAGGRFALALAGAALAPRPALRRLAHQPLAHTHLQRLVPLPPHCAAHHTPHTTLKLDFNLRIVFGHI